MNILEAIERERWNEKLGTINAINAVLHNDALDRITEAASKPRVMKRWGADEVPEKSGWYWYVHDPIRPERVPRYYDHKTGEWYIAENPSIDEPVGGAYYWIELEPTPVLPKDGEE